MLDLEFLIPFCQSCELLMTFLFRRFYPLDRMPYRQVVNRVDTHRYLIHR